MWKCVPCVPFVHINTANVAAFSSGSHGRAKPTSAVYGAGLSASGALAIPSVVVSEKAVTSSEVRAPRRISSLNTLDIRYVASGFGFSLFSSRTELYGSGLNNYSQISTRSRGAFPGKEYYISRKKIPLPGNPKIFGLSAGRAHSAVATSSGLFIFGHNVHGQCGKSGEAEIVCGAENGDLSPVVIPLESEVRKVLCLLDTTCLLTQCGKVLAFGLNEDGQCANGAFGVATTAAEVTGDTRGESIVEVSGSTDTMIAASEKGDVFVWGQNEYGQAGPGEGCTQLRVSRHVPLSIGRVVSVAATASSCIAVNEDGIAHVWGVGHLGLGRSVTRLAHATPMEPPLFNGKKVRRVFAGNTCVAAVNEDGELFIWGQNRFGQLGLGHDKQQPFPLQVYLPGFVKDVALGTDHSLFITK